MLHNNYFLIFCYYILFYLPEVLNKVGLGFQAPDHKILAFLFTLYLIGVYIVIPIVLLGRVILADSTYSLKGLAHVFSGAFLIAFAYGHLFQLSLFAWAEKPDTWIWFAKAMPTGIVLALFGGIAGLIGNSFYILMRRLLVS